MDNENNFPNEIENKNNTTEENITENEEGMLDSNEEEQDFITENEEGEEEQDFTEENEEEDFVTELDIMTTEILADDVMPIADSTITSTPSTSSLTVNGNTEVRGTISWTKPNVPTGATITSCVLTGRATASMSKGSATITVNGTRVTSGSNFTINLGTSNSTTSVATTAKGGNKNASGTVSFSNLVYTVTYTITYTVRFLDWNGTVLKTQQVDGGSNATPPSNPTRNGYRFTGWDKSYTNIQANTDITAQYVEIIYYTVTFVDWDGTVLKTEQVEEGYNATAPSNPSRDGYRFTDWDKSYTNVTSNLTVNAVYVEIVYYTVTFVDWNGTALKTQQVQEGESATAPNSPTRDGYIFTGWDKSYTNVTSNLTVNAQYREIIYYTVTFLDWNGTVLKTEQVQEGQNATPPSNPTREEYTFAGWDKTFDNIQSDLIVTAQYAKDLYSGVGTVVENLSGENPIGLNLYVDWDTQVVDVDISFTSFENITFSSENIPIFSVWCPNTDNSYNLRYTYSMGYKSHSLEAQQPSKNMTHSWPIATTIAEDNTVSGRVTVRLFKDDYGYLNFDFIQNNISIGKTDAFTDAPENLISIGDYGDVNVPDTVTFNSVKIIELGNEESEDFYYIAENLSSDGGWEYEFDVNWNSQYLDIEIIDHPSGIFGSDHYYRIENNNGYYDSIRYDSVDIYPIINGYIVSFDNFDTIRYSKKDGIMLLLNGEVLEAISDTSFANSNLITISSFSGVNYQDGVARFNIKITNISDGGEEPDDEIIEWTGVGTVVSDLLAYGQEHSGYKINLDWNNECFDVVVKTEYGYNYRYMNEACIGDIIIGEYQCYILYGDGYISLIDNDDNLLMFTEEPYALPITVRFDKNNISFICENEIIATLERFYEINQPIYFVEDHSSHNANTNKEYDLGFDLVVSELQSEESNVIAKYIMTSGGVNCFPFFNDEGIGILPDNVSYEDVDNGDGTTTRTLLSEESPEIMYFYGDTNVLQVLEFDISNQPDLSYSFYGCPNLVYVNTSIWDTSHATIMNNMFNSCTGLTQLDLSNWDTSNVEDMSSMFNSCTSLTQLDLSNWNMDSATDISYMFNNCPSLSHIGMLYSNKATCEKAQYELDGGTIYVQDTKASEYTDNGYVQIKDYLSQTIKINLPRPLRKIGNVSDKLYWDNEKKCYCIEQRISDNNSVLSTPVIIELNITNKMLFDNYSPYMRIETNGVAPSNLKVSVPKK